MENPRTAPTARFPVPKYIPKNIAKGGIEKIIAKNVLTQIVLINVSVEIFCFFFGNLIILKTILLQLVLTL